MNHDSDNLHLTLSFTKNRLSRPMDIEFCTKWDDYLVLFNCFAEVQLVAPLTGHNEDGVLVEFWSNKRVHLCHIATEPAGREICRELDFSRMLNAYPCTHNNQHVTPVRISTH
jgi:hypothetical protein